METTETKTTFLKIPFSEVFKAEKGYLTPLKVVSVNGVTFGPGVTFSDDVKIGGVQLVNYKEYDIAAENNDGVLVIKGFYLK